MAAVNYKIFVPIYKATVEVYICDESKDISETMKRLYDYDHDSTYTDAISMRIAYKSKLAFCLFLVDGKTKVSQIAHESLHLAWYILDHCNVEVDKHNQEALAYLIEYLCEEVLKSKFKSA